MVRDIAFEQRCQQKVPTLPLEKLFPGISGESITMWGEARPLLEFRHVEKSTSLLAPRELVALCSLTKWLKPRIIFEMGTFRGGTAQNFSLNSDKDTQIYSLDIAVNPDRLASVEKVTFLQGDTFTFSFRPWRGKCDLVFVDASHEEAAVRNDTKQALKILSPGGTLIWHDFCPKFPGVVTSVLELAKTLKIHRIAGTNLAVYRRSSRKKNPGERISHRV